MERNYKGQIYECVGVEDYRRRDGEMATLNVWASQCAVCGARFLAKVSATAEKFQPNRRCDAHKAPGKRVKRRKRKAAAFATALGVFE